jgi:hypothetical protein
MASRQIRERRNMAGLDGCLRHFAARAAFAALTAFTALPSADAQWFPPMGAAPPDEIIQRLRAEGYVLIPPLRRNQTIYLADVTSGSGGRERLVIDAWSGEILQRFVARRGSGRRSFVDGYVVEGGEFSSPPPLAPPPERDFREGSFAYGEPAIPAAPAPRWRVRPRPAATASRPPEPNPATAAAPPAQPVNPPGNGNSANPGAVAPTGAPSTVTEPGKPDERQPIGPTKLEASPAPPRSAQEAAPKSDVAPASPPATAQTQTKNASGPPPAPAAKPGDKSKVNDVPVNPLE